MIFLGHAKLDPSYCRSFMLTKTNLSLKPLGNFGNQSHRFDHGDHICGFYENTDHLADSICDFVVPGITRGDGIFLIASKTNLDKFQLALERRSIDVHRAKSVQKLIMLDAQETLNSFMVNGMPDPDKFENNVGKLISDFKMKYPRIRAFGEMVNILWEQNNLEGALKLEEMWSQLNNRIGFSLLCGYSNKKFKNKFNIEALNAICAAHTHIVDKGELTLKTTLEEA